METPNLDLLLQEDTSGTWSYLQQEGTKELAALKARIAELEKLLERTCYFLVTTEDDLDYESRLKLDGEISKALDKGSTE